MSDLCHQWGSDLQLGPTGDLVLSTGSALGQQRILRRLLTSPGDYVWHPLYGGGVASFIGQPGNALQISGVIRSQMLKEAAVAHMPEPSIEVDSRSTAGFIYVSLQYVDSSSGQTQLVAFPLTGG